MNNTYFWIVFNVSILLLLVIDLFLLNRKSETISVKVALKQSAFWIGLAVAFGAFVYYYYNAHVGHDAALEATENFITAYLIEESLSVDNLFVFMLIFSYFRVPVQYQRKVLFWGIIGALVLRALFILVGVELMEHFKYTVLILGGFLILTGIRMFISNEKDEVNPEKNPIVGLVYKMFRVMKNYEGGNFFTKQNGLWYATPLFVVVIVVETTDIVFALDSIPAVLAVSPDPFIIYTSNVFALLGLRSLYFALGGLMELFHYIHYGLAVILTFIGVKLILGFFHIHIDTTYALLVVAVVLGLSILLSLLIPKKNNIEEEEKETIGNNNNTESL